jgi:cytochrome c biogenesis protein CcdA
MSLFWSNGEAADMKRTRLSLFYLAGYLLPSGMALLVAPRFFLKLLFFDHDYGDVVPRLVGVLFIVVGIIVVQIIRYRLEMP